MKLILIQGNGENPSHGVNKPKLILIEGGKK